MQKQADMAHLDPIFREAQTEKALYVRPSLWNRLNQQLDQKKRRRLIWSRIAWVAACVVLVVAGFGLWSAQGSSNYQLEDLGTDYEVFISSGEVLELYKYYGVNQPEDLNG